MEPSRLTRTTITMAVLAALALASCRKKQQEDEKDLLARVGDHSIRIADFNRELERRQQLRRPVVGKEILLDEMVEYELLLQHAKRTGIDHDPDVRRAISNLLIGKLKEKELTPALQALTVSGGELQAAYETRRDSLGSPGMRRLSIIHVEASRRASAGKMAELNARIEEARKLARDGEEGFSAAAAKSSDDQATRYRGGDIGWSQLGKPHSRIPREVLDAGHALATDGKVSKIIKTNSGFYLVMPTATKSATTKPLAQVADRLRTEILKEKRVKARRTFEDRIKSTIPVELFPERLSEIDLKPATPDTGRRPPSNPQDTSAPAK